MTDDMTPAQARRALSGLIDDYSEEAVGAAFAERQDRTDPTIPPEEVDKINAIVEAIGREEFERKTGIDAPDSARGVEETPYGTAMAQKEGMTISWPVEFGVEVVGEPGRREVELTSENRLVDDLDDVMEALARNYPNDRAQDDPREAFISDAAAAVASRLGGDLDTTEQVGRVGTIRLRESGDWVFRRADGDDALEEISLVPDMESEGRTDTQQRSQGRRPGDTQPTTQRPERGQQTLAEAGTTESLSEFATGTVEDDPDSVIGPADETKRNTATTGGEFTQDRTSGLGQFEQFDATIRVGINRDEAKTNAFGEEIPANETAVPFIIPPEGRVIDMDLKNQLERRLYDAANVPMMIDAHGAGTTVTVGTATFSDGGGTFEGFSLNSNWEGRSNV